MKLYIDGSSDGWSADTLAQLTDGIVWRQDEYHYAYGPNVEISSGKMTVAAM